MIELNTIGPQKTVTTYTTSLPKKNNKIKTDLLGLKLKINAHHHSGGCNEAVDSLVSGGLNVQSKMCARNILLTWSER